MYQFFAALMSIRVERNRRSLRAQETAIAVEKVAQNTNTNLVDYTSVATVNYVTWERHGGRTNLGGDGSTHSTSSRLYDTLGSFSRGSSRFARSTHKALPAHC